MAARGAAAPPSAGRQATHACSPTRLHRPGAGLRVLTVLVRARSWRTTATPRCPTRSSARWTAGGLSTDCLNRLSQLTVSTDCLNRLSQLTVSTDSTSMQVGDARGVGGAPREGEEGGWPGQGGGQAQGAGVGGQEDDRGHHQSPLARSSLVARPPARPPARLLTCSLAGSHVAEARRAAAAASSLNASAAGPAARSHPAPPREQKLELLLTETGSRTLALVEAGLRAAEPTPEARAALAQPPRPRAALAYSLCPRPC